MSCSVTPYHCWFNEEDMAGYDTNLKVNPPLRTNADMMAIREAIKTRSIDCVASHHMPQHWDDKTCEFEYAKPGMIGLETLFGVFNSFGMDLTQLVEKLTIFPRKIFDIGIPALKEESKACLTLFDPGKQYVFEESMIRSRSKNTPFIGKELRGKVLGIINKGKIVMQ